MSKLDKITIGKYIAKGMMGTIYIATDEKGNKYAYKIGKILPKEVKKSLESEYWRENDFAENLSNKYPDQFMHLYDSKIENNCTHTQNFSGFDFTMNDLPKSQQNYYKKLEKSPYCSIKLWSLIDGDLKNLLSKNKLSEKEFYDIYIQIVYIVYLMNKNGYYHNDFHPGNIGYVKTNKKTIDILGHKIPTHGYLIKAIDFGLVLHKKYPMSKSWREKYENDNDLFTVVNLLSINLQNKKLNWDKWWNSDKKISKEEKEILKDYMPNHKLNKDNTKFFYKKLSKLLHYNISDEKMKGVKIPYLIPLDKILYVIKNIYEPKKVLLYLIKNRS
jgi:serine/threonine protein kinase